MKFDLCKYIPRLFASWLSMILIQNVSIIFINEINIIHMFLGILIFIVNFILLTIFSKKITKINVDSLFLVVNYFICSLIWLSQNNNILYLLAILIFFYIILMFFINKNRRLVNNIRINKKIYVTMLILIIIVPFLILLNIGILRYITYNTPNFDFGIFSHIFYYMKETFIPYSTCERDFLLSHFAVHFSPILYFILPIYYIFSNPVVLQICQVVLLYLGLIPLIKLCDFYKFSKKKKLIMVFLYSFFPILSSGTFFDFHENCFLPVLLLYVFYFFEKDNKFLFYVFIFLTLLVKEDVFIYMVIFALYIIISRKKYKLGLSVMIISLVYFCITAFFMNKYGLGIMSNRYENLIYGDSGLLGAIKTIIFNPGYTLTQLLSNPNNDFNKIIYLIKLFLPVMFIPFVTKKVSRYILLLPCLINLLTNYIYAYDVNFHYSYGILAFVFYLMILNLKDMRLGLSLRIFPFAIMTCFLFYYCFVFSCFKNNVSNYLIYKDDYKIVSKIINSIPNDAVVSSSTFYLPHLTLRKELYEEYYHTDLDDIDYIVLDMRYNDNNLEFYLNNGFEIIKEHSEFIAILKNK
ncbi:MAG: DUF2079 domain-containing protein [Bacilli bacterium]|nr:DUF2079 domain-containing protein [Bacilli bacterium]